MSRKMTKQQEKFAVEYAKSGNATEAYKKAYNTGNMKAKSIHENAAKLLKHAKIAPRIAELQAKAAKIAEEEFQMDAHALLEKHSLAANYDPSIYFDEGGRLKPLDQIPEKYRRLMEAKITATGLVKMLPPSREVSMKELGRVFDMTNNVNVKTTVEAAPDLTEKEDLSDAMRDFEDYRKRMPGKPASRA